MTRIAIVNLIIFNFYLFNLNIPLFFSFLQDFPMYKTLLTVNNLSKNISNVIKISYISGVIVIVVQLLIKLPRAGPDKPMIHLRLVHYDVIAPDLILVVAV